MSRRGRRRIGDYEKQYICFYEGEVDLAWDVSKVDKFKELWEAGEDIISIAVELKRHVVEVALLLIDLAESEQVERRPTGIYGLAGQLANKGE